ncbi:MAG: amino acid adenylation domain-containing protein [Clostridia bacterium]|nr:amino acid adenylation domain-containing protein [Clostridia bacterium]
MIINSAVRLLDKASEKYCDNVALTDENGSLTYGEYKKTAMNVAGGLLQYLDKSNKVKPVVVCMKKSKEMVCTFMGIMYCGGCYVPTQSDIPLSRLEKIVENLNPVLIVYDDTTKEHVLSANLQVKCVSYDMLSCSKANEQVIEQIVSQIVDTDPIYMMYTSGSTGVPKGVTVSHRGVVDYAIWTSKTFGFTQEDIFGNQAPFYFDNSIFDIYTCLLTGAQMNIIPESLFMFPSKLPEFIRDNGITTIFWVPTVMINVANSGALSLVKMPTLKNVLFCGEVMPNSALNVWRRDAGELMYANLYGPTEITDVCTYYIVDRKFDDNEKLPIGIPCENMKAIILTEDGKQAQKGEQGELCIGGSGVSLGYFNAKEITDKAFIQNPLNPYYHERLYRTGDICYMSEDGLIMYVGRMDSQIKLKGNRIELGEIENAAQCLEEIENACAIFDSENEKIFLFAETSHKLVLRKVNNELKKYIPKYMLPTELVCLEKLPHTANDKIDRVTLKKTYITGEIQ